MAKKKQVYDPQHEFDVLNTPVRMDGVGEDKVVQDLLSEKFVKGSDTEVAPIAMALAELVTGMKMNNAQQAKILARFDKIERAQKAWETDKKKFLEDIDKRSASLLTTNPLQKEKMQAEWMATAQEAREQATAQMAVSKLKFKAQLETEPKETIISPGVMETHREGEQLIPMIVPEVVAIKGFKWVLPPGQAIEVPHTVAVRYREMQRMNGAIEARKRLLKDGVNEASKVVKEWNQINLDYNTGGEQMVTPVA